MFTVNVSLILHWTKNYSDMKEVSFSLYSEPFAGPIFQYDWLRCLAFPVLVVRKLKVIYHWYATIRFWCCIWWREFKPKHLLTTDSEPSSTSHSIHLANREGSGVVWWPKWELAVTWPQGHWLRFNGQPKKDQGGKPHPTII